MEITKKVKPSEYYYGVKVDVFCNLPYKKAIIYKRDRAKELLKELTEEYFEKIENNIFDGSLSELQQRINDVKLAYEFNCQLIEECKNA